MRQATWIPGEKEASYKRPDAAEIFDLCYSDTEPVGAVKLRMARAKKTTGSLCTYRGPIHSKSSPNLIRSPSIQINRLCE